MMLPALAAIGAALLLLWAIHRLTAPGTHAHRRRVAEQRAARSVADLESLHQHNRSIGA